jgi:hypothetical protein
MKNLFLTLSILLSVSLTFGQGLKLDSANYLNTNVWQPPRKLGYSQSLLPKSYSLKKYCPVAKNQGLIATCVGWAVAYAGLTTAQNARMGLTDDFEKQIRAFDPLFLYGMIKLDGDYWCQEGTTITGALAVLSYFGCKPLLWYPWFGCNERNKYDEFTLDIASSNRIGQYFSVQLNASMEMVKTALADNRPVIIGMSLTDSFSDGNSTRNGIWNPKVGELPVGDHAMCVVGYDDYKYGGAFEVMNSWGNEFGAEGFIWIKYSDFYKYVKEAYVFDAGEQSVGSCSIGNCYNGYGRKKYSSDYIYEGYFNTGLPNYFGCFLFPDKSFYIGELKDGDLHGNGVFYDIEYGEYFDVFYKNNVLVQSRVRGFAAEEQSEKTNKIHHGLTSTIPNAKKGGTMSEKVRARLTTIENEGVTGE